MSGSMDSGIGIDTEMLRELYGIECMDGLNVIGHSSPEVVAVFQKPDYDFVIFCLVKNWVDGYYSLYAMVLHEGIGNRLVAPSIDGITIEDLWHKDDADWVGLLGPGVHATTLAEYINGYIEKGEWSRWFN